MKPAVGSRRASPARGQHLLQRSEAEPSGHAHGSACLLLFDRAVRDGPQDLRIKPCEARQLLGIGVVALAITMGYRTQLTDVRNNDLMTQLLQFFPNPHPVPSPPHP